MRIYSSIEKYIAAIHNEVAKDVDINESITLLDI